MSYDWRDIEAARTEGRKWPEIAARYGVTADTLRKAYSRHRGRSADSPKENTAWVAPRSQDGMKILGLDIETAPHTAYVWSLFKQTIYPDQLMQTGRVMCFSARWFSDGPGARTAFVSEFHDGHQQTVRRGWSYLDEADAVVHYNGSKFDIPMLAREFIKAGLGPPSPFAEIDLLKVARQKFRFASDRLDHILQELQIGQKVRHAGQELWTKCMDGDPEAWGVMRAYNIGDVELMEQL